MVTAATLRYRGLKQPGNGHENSLRRSARLFFAFSRMNYFQRTPIRFRTILITAGVLATLFLFQAYMHFYVYKDLKDMAEFNWWREAPVPYLNFLFWALLCPVVYSILRKWPFNERPLVRNMLIHLGLSLMIASVHEMITSAIYYSILMQIGDFDLNDPIYRSWAINSLPPAIFTRTMEYWVLMGVLIGLENARLRREEHEQLLKLRTELQISQLNALKKQLQPHFLFNTLNTVSALMDENINDARKVLSRLGQLLRVTLEKSQRDKVPLEREIDHVANYLGIEAIRFRDRLHVDYEIPGGLGHAQVPSMVLQPLVENAIKHGPDSHSGPMIITIRAERSGERLRLK
ncbi:MAG: histidine kinase, partial [Bacteroidota bacterium]|nr:histidine kinase [Bacteroidota bacterium]